MATFLNTRGRTKLAIAICGRCSRKFPYDELMPDPNSPGLYVCRDDLDVLDPWRLQPRATEDISLDHPRPDVPIYGNAGTPIWTPVQGVTPIGVKSGTNGAPIATILPAVPWAPKTAYPPYSSVTPINLNSNPLLGPVMQFITTEGGFSGATPPAWPTQPGQTVADGSGATAILWLCWGICLDEAAPPAPTSGAAL